MKIPYAPLLNSPKSTRKKANEIVCLAIKTKEYKPNTKGKSRIFFTYLDSIHNSSSDMK